MAGSVEQQVTADISRLARAKFKSGNKLRLSESARGVSGIHKSGNLLAYGSGFDLAEAKKQRSRTAKGLLAGRNYVRTGDMGGHGYVAGSPFNTGYSQAVRVRKAARHRAAGSPSGGQFY